MQRQQFTVGTLGKSLEEMGWGGVIQFCTFLQIMIPQISA
jgi:hypothetical protein